MVVEFSARLLMALCLLALAVTAQATPKIQQWTTDNGAKVLFVPAPELPMVDIRVVFDAGSARDGDLPGLAVMTNALLSEGAGGWDADQIAERVESVGANLSVDALRDMAIVSLRSLTEKKALEKAVATMQAVINRPDFPRDAIERNLQALKILLRQEQQLPGTIASKAFYRAMYGDHPYAHPSNGTEETPARINRRVLQAFHRQYYVGSNAVIAIVGDVDRQQAEALADTLLGDLPRGEPAPSIAAVDVARITPRKVIEFPSQQAHLFIGMPAIRRGDADYFALYVGNHVLGGSGLTSMISQEIREKRGLAYSAYSYFAPMRGEGPFIIGLQTRNDQVEQAEKVVLQTLADYIENGPSAEELKKSKLNITGGFPLRLASNGKIVEYLAMIGFYDLPLDYLDDFVENINAVSAEAIQDAFQRRLDAAQFATVIVGQVSD